MRTCRLCGSEFPAHVVIDGRERNLQNRKFCLQCSPYGSHNTRTLRRDDVGNVVAVTVARVRALTQPEFEKLCCSRCGRKYTLNRKQGHQLTLCNSCSANRQRVKMKQRCVDYKGGKCQCCGYDRSLRSLTFHHRNADEKEFTLAGKMSWAWSKLARELDKCDLLCANCHYEIHDELELKKRTEHLAKEKNFYAELVQLASAVAS
jgi:hypothetical protein